MEEEEGVVAWQQREEEEGVVAWQQREEVSWEVMGEVAEVV